METRSPTVEGPIKPWRMVPWVPGIKAGPEDILVRLVGRPGKGWDGGDLFLCMVKEDGSRMPNGGLLQVGYRGVHRMGNISRKLGLGLALEPPSYALRDLSDDEI